MFGFLEFEDAPDILPPLLEAASIWLRAHGRDRMVGPMDFTMNDECGVLIEGFERMPFLKQPWHPPYYAARCEEAGLAKAVDLFMYELVIDDRSKILPIVFKLAEQVESRHGITIRRMSRRSLRRDLDRFAEVYNEAWSENWGFVPFSERDLDVYAQEMQLVFDRNWFMVAETAEGETAAVAITVPDINQVLAKMNGRAAAVRLVALPAQGRGRSTGCGSASSASSTPTSTRGSRRRSTSSTSTPPTASARSGARWAGSSRPTAT